MNKATGVILLLIALVWCTACDGPKYVHGQRSYLNYCADCHMDDGMGVADLYPALVDRSLIDKYKEMPCIIRQGINEPMSLLKMPGNPKMRAVDITNIINYIIHDLNDSNANVLLKDVNVMLEECE